MIGQSGLQSHHTGIEIGDSGYSVSMDPAFNRTTLELKCANTQNLQLAGLAFNRTTLELKFYK